MEKQEPHMQAKHEGRTEGGEENLGFPAKAIDAVAGCFSALSSFFMIVCAIIVTIDIFARYLRRPTTWGNDITIYFMVIFVFLSLAPALKKDAHISADLLLHQMNARMARLMKSIGLLFTFLFTSVFAYYMSLWALRSLRIKERSHSFLRMYLWPLKTIMAVCLIVLALMALRLLLSEVRKVVSNADREAFGKGFNSPALIIGLEVVLIAAGCLLTAQNHPVVGLVIVLITLLISGTPIAFSILGTALITLFLAFRGFDSLATAPAMAYEFVSKYTVLALPMFIFAGNVMARGGLGEDIFNFARAYLGHIRSGMGIAVIVACTIFGALSGSSVACAMTIGTIGYPFMVESGYSKGMAAGLVAIAGGIGVLIPPSNSFITYGLVAEVPIGPLFIAGVVPGLLMGLFLAVVTVFLLKREKNITVSPKTPWGKRLKVTRKSLWALCMPVLVLGSIYSGICTITEAAAVGAIYATLYSISARTISFSGLVKVLTSSMNSVAFLLLIMMVSTILAKCVVLMRIPDMLLSSLAGTPGWVFILIIMIFCIFLGCFLEGVAITTLTVPVVVPMLNAYGYNLIWYGVLLTVNLTIAAVTPPVGLNLFVMQKIGNLSIAEVTRGAMPYLFIILVLMIVIAAFPQLSLFLPAHMGR